MRLSRSVSAVLARVERLLYVLIWLVTLILAVWAGIIGYALGVAEGGADQRYKLLTLQSKYDLLEANYKVETKRRNALELRLIDHNFSAGGPVRGADSSGRARQGSDVRKR